MSKVRRWLLNKLLNQKLQDEIFEELWERGKAKGKASYSQRGKVVTYHWSNSDKIVFKLPYETVKDNIVRPLKVKVPAKRKKEVTNNE